MLTSADSKESVASLPGVNPSTATSERCHTEEVAWASQFSYVSPFERSCSVCPSLTYFTEQSPASWGLLL